MAPRSLHGTHRTQDPGHKGSEDLEPERLTPQTSEPESRAAAQSRCRQERAPTLQGEERERKAVLKGFP